MISKKEIEAYVKGQNATLNDCDLDKGEFHYTVCNDKGSYTIHGYTENVKKWLDSLIPIDGELCQIKDWFLKKMYLNTEELHIEKETEKAFLVSDGNDDMWIPKSVIFETGLKGKKVPETYEGIKKEYEELLKEPDKERLLKIYNKLRDLIADANNGKGELVRFTENGKIPLHSEPMELRWKMMEQL